MGILGGLLQFGANAVQPALQVGVARNQAQLAANKDRQQQLLQMLVLQRQQQQADIEATLKAAQARQARATSSYRGAQQHALENPKPMIERGPGGQLVQIDPKNPSNVQSIGPAPIVKPTQPIMGSPEWLDAEKARARIAAQYRPAPANFTPFQGTDDQGKPVVRPFNTKTGQFGPAADVAPKAAVSGAGGPAAMSRAGQFGEMLKKAQDLLPQMEQLDVKLGQSAASDVAQHGVGVGGLRIPGSAAVGSMLVNRSPDFASYQAMLDPFVLANAHALSGARINQDQARMIKQSIEMKPGDPPQVRQQRIKNVVDQMNSTAASLPPDLVAAQEAQMDPATLTYLRSKGYRGRGTGAPAGAPAGASSAPGNPPGRSSGKAAGTPDITDVESYLKALRSRKP